MCDPNGVPDRLHQSEQSNDIWSGDSVLTRAVWQMYSTGRTRLLLTN